MRKIREVLRLRFEPGLEQRAIARACSISQSTVHEYLRRAAAGNGLALQDEWDNRASTGRCSGSGNRPDVVGQAPLGSLPQASKAVQVDLNLSGYVEANSAQAALGPHFDSIAQKVAKLVSSSSSRFRYSARAAVDLR
jgi:hypothetical protein